MPKNTPVGSTFSDYLHYSMPQIAVVWLMAPISVVQGVYAKYYAISLTTLATVILFSRIFDAVTDPLIGYFSDRYRRRTGTRKPFILVGGLLMTLSAYCLYVPFDVSIIYFVCWFMVFYLAHTLFEVPHNAWASELALTSGQKSTVYTFRSIAGYLGLALFYSIPLLPIFETPDITPATLKVTVIAATVLMLPLLFLCMIKTPNGAFDTPPNQTSAPKLRSIRHRVDEIRVFFASILCNKPLLIFFAAYLFIGLGLGMWYGLIFIYVDSYLGLGGLFAQMFLLAFVAGILATPAWGKLAILLGKKTTLVLAVVLLMASFSYTAVLRPEDTGFSELMVLKITNTLGLACLMAIAPAMLSEIIDYSTWKFHSEKAATYFSLYAFISKTNTATGAGLSLAIAGWYGFDATATVSTQSTEGVRGLMLAMVWCPLVFSLLALVLLALSPINARRHLIIRRCLDARVVRSHKPFS